MKFDPPPGQMAMTDIVAAAWGMLWKYLPRWLALAPLIVLTTVVLQLAVPETAEGEQPSDAEVGRVTAIFLGSLLVQVVAYCTIVAGALATVQGQAPDPAAAYRRGLRAIPVALLATLLLMVVVSFLAFLGALIPPLVIVMLPLITYLLFSWSLLIPVAVADGGTPFAVLRKSRALVRGQWWRTAGIQVALVLLTVLPLLVGGAVSGSGNKIAIALVTGAIAALTGPFQYVGQTLLYADLRARKGEPLPAAPRPTLT